MGRIKLAYVAASPNVAISVDSLLSSSARSRDSPIEYHDILQLLWIRGTPAVFRANTKKLALSNPSLLTACVAVVIETRESNEVDKDRDAPKKPATGDAGDWITGASDAHLNSAPELATKFICLVPVLTVELRPPTNPQVVFVGKVAKTE